MLIRRGVLSDLQRQDLSGLIRASGTDRVVADRARMVLWWDDDVPAAEIADRLGVTPKTVRFWTVRYAMEGRSGLADRFRVGKPRLHDGDIRARLLALSRTSPPPELSLSHWSSRELARYFTRTTGVAVSHAFIAELWREHDLQPWRQGTFKLSKDPRFEEKVTDVVALYLDPPPEAVVLSVDEKTQVQALDRTQPMLPVDFGKTEKRTHDYKRNGTTDLFAAMNVGTGEVTAACCPTHKSADFLRFLERLVAKHPDQDIHIVLDNASAHTSAETNEWLAKHPRVTFHFTPTGGSWLNQIETWFGIFTRQSLRRGTHKSVKQLIDAINRYVADWNSDCSPFKWTATAEQIIAKVRWVASEVQKMMGAREISTITRH
jgi:transposase